MKKYSLLPLLAFLIVSMGSCQAIAGIFKAGFNTALILVGIVVIVIIFLVVRGRGKS